MLSLPSPSDAEVLYMEVVVLTISETRSQGLAPASTRRSSPPLDKNAIPDNQIMILPLQTDTNLTAANLLAGDAPTTQLHAEDVWTSLAHGQVFDFTDVEFTDGFFIDDSNIEFTVPTNLGSFANTPSIQLLQNDDHNVLPSTPTINIDPQKQQPPGFPDLIFSPLNSLQNFEEISNQGGDVTQTHEVTQSSNASAPAQPNRRPNGPRDQYVLPEQACSVSDSRETVKHLFDSHLSDVLSIGDDRSTNPWQVHVWPMADGCPALYHALAAMSYSYTSKSQPQPRAAGVEHFGNSVQAFAQVKDNSSISLEASLATRLALSFAESWDDQQVSPGMQHIRLAGELVRDAFNKHKTTRLTGAELDRLSFLARTWMYKNVVTRLTTSYEGDFDDMESMTAYIQLHPLPLKQLDPLMGYAIALFPLLGHLADIIKSVRRRTEKHNSPFMIPKGAELRLAIEGWTPSFDPERSGGITPHTSDIIQTAEAYRWAALLLLRQAIPELPWIQSFWELAEKVSIYLATTPVTSRTMIVQTFPLMAIAGEAFEREDRDWVRERWDAMSKRMPLSRLDRYKRVTEEVWRRRDAFEAKCGACPSCGAFRLSSPGTSPNVDSMTATVVPVPSSSHIEGGNRRCRCSATTTVTAPPSGFPDSLAFEKGIDNITRASNLHYTVRGNLHWLGVMKDWDWEVTLG
ncbi:fungal-specific transcription factor domain-containing protein [Exophiala viscosa]|uniref:Fungal-specific transcription factor domain-containing protein n=1 Tax=Exophiala viscosa TaxID=2486360 RepID=A0AAN6IEL3_9EURO|nr:fungal-specific transcription factor domain-containing protein [Exophiala viscosa]KAI1624413.1 fungal-specific transcription factor domain-containing protein [Exophiala viscosa]